jgi:hypothetical protein
MYRILPYTYNKARRLGVVVKPSLNKLKKIDVFKRGKLIASIGAIGYSDYPTYIETHGLVYANQRRKLYRQRHVKDLRTGAGYWANQLLW